MPDYVRPIGGSLDGVMGSLDSIEVGALTLSSGVSNFFTGDVAEVFVLLHHIFFSCTPLMYYRKYLDLFAHLPSCDYGYGLLQVLVYRTGLTVADIDRVGTYLSKKYALPWRPTAGPTIVTVVPSRGPAAGGIIVTVLGSGFAGAGVGHLRAVMAGVECEGVERLPSGAGVLFYVPPGIGFAAIQVIRDAVSGYAQVSLPPFSSVYSLQSFWLFLTRFFVLVSPGSFPIRPSRGYKR